MRGRPRAATGPDAARAKQVIAAAISISGNLTRLAAAAGVPQPSACRALANDPPRWTSTFEKLFDYSKTLVAGAQPSQRGLDDLARVVAELRTEGPPTVVPTAELLQAVSTILRVLKRQQRDAPRAKRR